MRTAPSFISMAAGIGWANFGARLAVATGKRVIVPDYRLAPEYPFPAALHDAVSVYRALLDDGAAPLVGGDSAGGGLAAALVLACADLGLPAPAGLVLLSPWVDLTVTAPTYDSRATTDQLFPRESAGEAAAQYLQSHDTDDKLASPLNGDLSGFPPTLIFASADECLLGDSLALQARLAEARREVALHVAPGMPHVWPVIMPAAAQTRAAFETIKAFVATQDYAARM
jgi:monoterpene epsilon-lactone hydrolase